MSLRTSDIYPRLISILKKIPHMLDDEEIRYNLLLNGFEPGERSTLGSRPNDAIADLERIVNHASTLQKLDKLIENAKIRDPGQAIKDELDKIQQEIRNTITQPSNKDSIEDVSTQNNEPVPASQAGIEVKIEEDFSRRFGYVAQERLEDEVKYFSWLHLTDLHRGMKEQHWLWPGVREIFFEDLKKLHEKCGPWDLVLFSGDLTQQGTAKEFEKVNDLLNELWEQFEKLGFSPKILAVPGNHDLVRPKTDDPSVLLLKEWSKRQNIQDEFWDKEKSPYRKVVIKAFKNYARWWQDYPLKVKDVNSGILPGDFSATLEKDGAKLGIVGLNTSFLQLTADDYEGKLALHARQFHKACGGDGPKWAKQHHACLLLTHHPPAWLNPASRQHLNAEITDHGRFVVHLCGHKHEATSCYTSEAGTEERRMWQGRSLFGLEYFGENEDRQHGYTVGKIELIENQGKLTFWPREARLQGGQRNIIADSSIVLTDEQHTKPKDFELLRPYIIESHMPASESLPDNPEGDREHIREEPKTDLAPTSSPPESQSIRKTENSPSIEDLKVTKKDVLNLLHQAYRREPDEWVSSEQIRKDLHITQEQLNDFILALREKGFLKTKYLGEKALLKITADGVAILK